MGDVAPLTAAQDRALARLIEAGIVEDLYLAGGVGIAIHLGHRQSIDLDFFSCRPDFEIEQPRDRRRRSRAWFEQAATAELARRSR